MRGKPYKNIIGEKFGRLTVSPICEVRNKKRRYWLCKCDCGNEKWVYASSLLSGTSVSCGCYRKETIIERTSKPFSVKKTRIFRIYTGMMHRCYNIKQPNYKNYGGKGVTVCDEWRNDFRAFFNFCRANGYNDSLQIDRKKSDGNYEPSNCRFVPIEENSSRKLDYIKVDVIRNLHSKGAFNNEELSGIYGVSPQSIKQIIERKTWKRSLSYGV